MADQMSAELWSICDAGLWGRPRVRLDRVACVIPAGVTAILGESGAGKSSLLNLLAGMERPDQGTVQRLFDSPPDQLPVYWAPQGGGLWPHLNSRQHLTAVGKDEESADKLLARFDLADRRMAFPAELSQGERARLSVARALSVKAHVLLFDEPLIHVDGERKAIGWKVIREHIQTTGSHLVLTTHESDVVLREADSVVCLREGQVVWQGPVMTLYHEPPNERVGRFLGPLNWFDEVARADWLANDALVCLRPERLAITPASESIAIVENSEFLGAHAETTLQHTRTGERRTFVHRSISSLETGTGVSVAVQGKAVSDE